MLPLTIIVVCILFIISFLIFDRDLLAPPTAVALTFLFGCLCCFYNEIAWELNFSVNSLALIAAGIIATMIGGIIGVLLSNYPRIGSFTFAHEITEPEEISISPLKTWIVVAFQIVTIVLVFKHIQGVTGYSSWVLAVARYKVLTGLLADVNDSSLWMSPITRNMNEISRLFAIVYAYVIGNNLIAKKRKVSIIIGKNLVAKRRKFSINWIPVVVYTILSFLQGGRSNLIRLWLIVLITAYTVHKRSVGWRRNKKTKKVFRIMVLSVIAVGALFVGVREIVGRTADSNPLYYLAFYAGSPIAVLNQVWESPITKPEIFGQRILYHLNQTTRVIFGFPERYNFYYEYMKSPNGSHIGNAPTAFRPAFVEFGPLGFFIFFIACGAFFTYLYCRTRKKRGNNPIDFRLLIYAYVAYVFMMYFYSTFFDFLGHIFIKYVIELLMITWALTRWKFNRHILKVKAKR